MYGDCSVRLLAYDQFIWLVKLKILKKFFGGQIYVPKFTKRKYGTDMFKLFFLVQYNLLFVKRKKELLFPMVF